MLGSQTALLNQTNVKLDEPQTTAELLKRYDAIRRKFAAIGAKPKPVIPQPVTPEPAPLLSPEAEEAIITAKRQIMETDPTPAKMLRIVARYYGVGVAEIRSPKRDRVSIRWRGVYCWLAFHHGTQSSFKEIGKPIHRDHATTMNALDMAEERRLRDPEFGNDIVAIQLILSGRKR